MEKVNQTWVVHTSRVASCENFISHEWAMELTNLAETTGFKEATVRLKSGEQKMPLIRNNQRVVLEDKDCAIRLWDKLSCWPPSNFDIQDETPCGLPKTLRFYKYQPGERFKMHKDGPWVEDGKTSRLTLLIYLNEGFSGGETNFRDFKIIPKTGKAVLFNHNTWHEGGIVLSGVKFVLRSDVLYSNRWEV